MKKVTLTVISLSLVALLAAGAMAGQWGPGRGQGRGYGMGPGAYAQLTPEQQADLQKKREAFEKERAAFLKDTLQLRQKMTAKRQEFRTLIAQPNFDQAKAKALANEMVDLRAQLAKKRIEHFSELPGGFRRGFRRGGGYGPGDCPGYGPGGGPGYGKRGGRGARGGYGTCWR